MEIRIDVSPDLLDLDTLQEVLKGYARKEGVELELKLRRPKAGTRVEPTVLVAIVSAAGTALGALVGGLLNVSAKGAEQKIVIKASDGKSIEYPADLASARVNDLVEKLRKLDSPTIKIT